MDSEELLVEIAMTNILNEYKRARKLHAPMHSAHEGYAILKEEVDELWDEIKANDYEKGEKECIQVGAMALALLVEIYFPRKQS